MDELDLSHINTSDKSVALTALTHGALSLVALLAIAGMLTLSAYVAPARKNASVGHALLGGETTEDGPTLSLKQRLPGESDRPPPAPVAIARAQTAAPAPVPSPITITPLDEIVVHVGAMSISTDGLIRAPVPKVHADGRFGIVPIIAADGTRPADVYARPRNRAAAEGTSAIAITVGGLGLNREVTQRAIDALPREVTLAFVPYAKGLQDWIDKARAAGHETLLEIPMEPYDYPNNDSGPHTLLTGADKMENIRRLEYLLSRAAGYFGLINYQGAKFVTHKAALAPVMDQMAERGLVFFHDGAAPRSAVPELAPRAGLGVAVADYIIDDQPEPDAINDKLLQMEAVSLRDGHALGAAFAFPVTIDVLGKWTRGLKSKGFDLVPASTILHLTTPGAPS